MDNETGTYYLRARYYDPAVGRYTQQDSWDYADPDDPLSLNLYVYCVNKPIYFTDPSGHVAVVDDIAIIFLLLASGELIAITSTYFVSPEGQKLLRNGATVYKVGRVPGRLTEEDLRTGFLQIKAGAE